jgi:hypothetical protein
MGVCVFDYLYNFLANGYGDFIIEIPKIKQEGIRFIRVNSCGLFPPEWQTAYIQDKPRFLARTKIFLDVAKDNNIGVIMSLFWRHATIPDIVNERVNTGLATPNSATRNFCAQYIEDLVGTFKDHPAISGWEVGNEYSLFAANSALPHVNIPRGSAASYSAPDDVMTLETMRSFYSFVVTEIKKHDTTNRIVMSGNGGPGGVIEKTLENYLPMMALDNPMDTWSYHKYARNNFGSRAYADFRDSLIQIREAAYAVEKPFILGEFGQEKNEVHGGFGGLPIFKAGADAVYRSGIQLAFAWEWKRSDALDWVNDFAFHPENVISGTNKVFEVFKHYNDLMKVEGYIPPGQLAIATPPPETGLCASGTPATVTVANHVSLNTGTGFCVSFKLRKTRDDLANRKILFKYNTVAGWFIGTGAIEPNGGGNTIYAQVRWSDGSTTSTNNQTMPQKVSDGWVRYIFQLDETEGSPTRGITIYKNGIWIATMPVPAGKTYDPSPTDLFMFAEGVALSPSFVELKDVRLFNRALTDVEARNLDLYNIAPANITISRWLFNGDVLDSVGTNNGTVSSGTINFVAA